MTDLPNHPLLVYQYSPPISYLIIAKSMSSLPHSAEPQRQLQSRSKIQQFRVEIRDRQISQFKNNIRQEMLRSNTIEELLQQVPADYQSANYWAIALYNAYSSTYRFKLGIEHIIDIFKLVEKFPNLCTLQLFEVVIARADEDSADLLFQYDVMRVLHGFINFTGKDQLMRCPMSSFSCEESRIISEVVISSAVETIQRNSADVDCYFSRLGLARISLRIIAELCRKSIHVRNFAIINHKTYTYCLKAHKCFQKDIDNQFYNFLQAVTDIPFDRWEDHFKRITSKILHLFYREKMNVRIQLMAEKDDRSYLLAYESLVLAMRNLFQMQIQWMRLLLQGVENSEGTLTLGMIVDIIAQCNYVMEFPAAQEQNQNLMPIKLMQATLEFAMRAIEALANSFPRFFKHPLYQQYGRQLIRFLRNREIGFSYGPFVVARRIAMFQLDVFLFQIPQDEATITSFIVFDPQYPQDNLIALIAYQLQSDTDIENKTELCCFMRHIIQLFPPCTFEPFIAPSQLFRMMLDRLVEQEMWCGDELRMAEQAFKLHIIHVLLQFFTSSAPRIGDRVHYYISLLSQYSERIRDLLLHQSQRSIYRYGKELLKLLGESVPAL